MKAVVFVDVQKDFIDGALGSEWAKKVTPEIIKYAKECRAKGYALYATADTHQPTEYENGEEIPQAAKGGYLTTLEGKRLPVEHCINGTDGHKIAEGLVKDENRDVIIPQGRIFDKPTFGCFQLAEEIADDFRVDQQNEVGDIINEPAILNEPLDEIQVCGFCTSICVAANAIILRAKFPNTKITVLGNLCADVSEENHKAARIVLEAQQIDWAE